MKKTCLVLLVLFFLIFGFELGNALGQTHYKPDLRLDIESNEYVLSWSKLPYPTLYQVEALAYRPPNGWEKVRNSNIVASYLTWNNHFTIERNFPFRTYWRVSARGLFYRPFGNYSDAINLVNTDELHSRDFNDVKPAITSHYPPQAPAPLKPFLTWTVVPGAVYYEVEFLDRLPENPNGTEASQYRVYMTREVFTNGYNPNFEWYSENSIVWRVRALDYEGHPLGVFSNAEEVVIDRNLPARVRPPIATKFNVNGAPTPLYPAYSWLPLYGASSYEVELTTAPPEIDGGILPSRYRVWSKRVSGFDCYDDEARSIPGTYYWRVRGLDEQEKPVGEWSEPGQYVVNPRQYNYAATLGDSITHGGGAVSYSPAAWEYSYQTYLSFTAVNLGKSGDTSETLLERFDRDVLPFKPKFLLILGGTNSLRGGTPAAEVIKDLAGIRDKCQSYGIRPIFLTLPPINPNNIQKVFQEETAPNWQAEFDAVNRFIRTQQYFIDLQPRFTDADGELPDSLAIDGLHPDIEGKKLIAKIINEEWQRVTR